MSLRCQGTEEQGAGTVETLFLDIVISARHQSVAPLVPGQQSKALRARRCGRRGAQRGAR
jgi:hypothetical protein